MQPPGIEPGSTVLQTAAMTTSAKVALIGVLDGERSHTIAFTEQCADHYTTNTIDWYRVRESNPSLWLEGPRTYPEVQRDIKNRIRFFYFQYKIFSC